QPLRWPRQFLGTDHRGAAHHNGTERACDGECKPLRISRDHRCGDFSRSATRSCAFARRKPWRNSWLREQMTDSGLRDLVLMGSFGPFVSGGQEVLRRIFVTVRDKNWREIAPVEWDCAVDGDGRGLRISARHRNDLVDFEWQGTLECSPDMRSIHFGF